MRGKLARKQIAEMKLAGKASAGLPGELQEGLIAEEGKLSPEEGKEARAATRIQAVVRGRRCRAAQVGPGISWIYGVACN